MHALYAGSLAAGRMTWSDDMERARRLQMYEEARPMTWQEKVLAFVGVAIVLGVTLVGVAWVMVLAGKLWP